MTRRPGVYRCHTCGETLASWAAAERHADTHHGARIDIVIGGQAELPPAAIEDIPTGGAL
jgi:hypothetical protein